MKPSPNRPPRALFLALATALLPVLALGALEGALRLAGYGHDLALFVPAPSGASDRELMMVNPQVAHRYFPEGHFVPRPLLDFFARQ